MKPLRVFAIGAVLAAAACSTTGGTSALTSGGSPVASPSHQPANPPTAGPTATPVSNATPVLSPPIVGTETGPPCPSAPAGTAPPAGKAGNAFTVVPTWPVQNTIGLAGLAVAADHNIYLTDTWFNRICRVAPDGTGSTFAGIPQRL